MIDSKSNLPCFFQYIFEWSFTLQFFGTWALIFGISIITLLLKAEQLYASSKRLKSVLTLNATTISIVKTAIILVSALTGIYLEVNYVRFFCSSDNQSKLFHALTPIYPTPFSAVVSVPQKRFPLVGLYKI